MFEVKPAAVTVDAENLASFQMAGASES